MKQRALRLAFGLIRAARWVARTWPKQPTGLQSALDFASGNAHKKITSSRGRSIPHGCRAQPPVDCRHLSASVFTNELA